MEHFSENPGQLGFCFLARFEEPIGDTTRLRMSARYTLRWTTDLEDYVFKARGGNSGIPIFDYLYQEEIRFQVVKVWKNVPRSFKRRLQQKGNYRRYDPSPLLPLHLILF